MINHQNEEIHNITNKADTIVQIIGIINTVVVISDQNRIEVNTLIIIGTAHI